MKRKGRSAPSGDEQVELLRLCREDRRKLYGLLDADLPGRVRRIEFALIGLLVMNGARVIGGVPIEEIPAAIFRLFT